MSTRTPFTASDCRLLWSCIPADCKTYLARLKASGRWDEARPAILESAKQKLVKLPGGCNAFEVAAALELEAQKWMEAHP